MMTNKEILERVIYITSKGCLLDNEINDLWSCYEQLYGPYKGNRNCGECIREAARKIKTHLANE